MHSPAEWIAIAVGVLLIVNGILWRQLHLRRKRRAQPAGLDDPSPAVRAATVEAMTAGGLAAYAGALEDLIKTEQDPKVLEAVAEAVFDHQWEPASVPAMIQLRIWASNRTPAASASEEFLSAPGPAVELLDIEPPEVERPEVASEGSRPEMPTVWPVAPVAAADEVLIDQPEPESEADLAAEQEPVCEPEPVREVEIIIPEVVGWEEPIEPIEPIEQPEPELKPMASTEAPAAESTEELVLEPMAEPLFGAPTSALLEAIQPASPELVAASEPVAEAVAKTLGTTVRSLRITTLEGEVTAQWPR